MTKSKYDREIEVSKLILQIHEPFTVSQLFNIMSFNNVSNDKELIIDILDQLYESGLIEPDFSGESFKYKVISKQ